MTYSTTILEIDLKNKHTGFFDEKLKEEYFTSNKLQDIFTEVIEKGLFRQYRLSHNNIIISSLYGNKHLKLLCEGKYNSRYGSSLYFYQMTNPNKVINDFSIQELQYIGSKIKKYFEKYLNYGISEPKLFTDLIFYEPTYFN